MNNNTIYLKPICDLLGMNFFIPSYQRGYRWTEQQVKDLLEDIDSFNPTCNKSSKESFYCLQPVVVKKLSLEITKEKKLQSGLDNNIWYEVVDGQQRLTTISLIIHYFNEMWVGKQKIKEPQIGYETRPDSSVFLKNIEIDAATNKVKTTENDNIDYHHITVAYQTIHDWVTNKTAQFDNNSFQSKFQQKTQVIWYEINDNNPIDTFIRINIGKIPLTNSELIKALFLQKRNFGDEKTTELRQIEIANEWDRIEYTLQNDDFWGFINKAENKKPARIEFLFDLMCENNSLKLEKYKNEIGSDDYKTFRYFNFYFQTKKDASILTLWNDVKDFFLVLEEWFNDRELYHKVGYLIAVGKPIAEIIIDSQRKHKDEFITYLNTKIAEQIKCDKIEDLEYGPTNKRIQDILLLHNIQTLLNNENETTKFPFDRYKKESWDIEHIHAIATEVKVKKENQAEWLKNNFTKSVQHNNEEINKKIENFIDSIDENDFATIIEYVLGEEDNGIRNLCLLDSRTNRSYKNDAFKSKRAKIIIREKEGTFIPICTKNVFMKYYSNNVENIEMWDVNTDRVPYLEEIKSLYRFYKN